MQCGVLWKIKNEWKWQYADKACACSLKREKLKELSTSDNCRMCGCCFKTQFNFKSGWISSENMFVAPTRKGETLPELANLLKNKLFNFLDDGESLFMKVCSPCGTKV